MTREGRGRGQCTEHWVLSALYRCVESWELCTLTPHICRLVSGDQQSQPFRTLPGVSEGESEGVYRETWELKKERDSEGQTVYSGLEWLHMWSVTVGTRCFRERNNLQSVTAGTKLDPCTTVPPPKIRAIGLVVWELQIMNHETWKVTHDLWILCKQAKVQQCLAQLLNHSMCMCMCMYVHMHMGNF